MPENAKFTASPKVVRLEPESQRVNRSRIARLPAPVHAVHEKGKYLLLQQLKVFFDRADDSLFELADKAHSNQEQNLYFDSMREVRVQRMGIERRFADAIDAAFALLISPEAAQENNPYDDTLSADALSLVQNEDLEEMVAVDSSIAKATREHGEDIQHLSLRLDSLVPVKVYIKNNPLGPDVLCKAFMDQTKRLDVGIKAKLVLFKLFDSTVIGNLGGLYKAANQTLIEHNVLPSLSTKAQGRAMRRATDIPSGQATGYTQTQSTSQSENVSPEVLVALQSILNQPAGGGQQVSPEVNGLLHLLSAAQRMPQDEPENVRLNIRDLLAQMQQQQGISASIGRVDDEVINLVNMLFDFILEDRNLAHPMKALISRMQIPVIKVALVDKSFFTKGGHVARRLLNEMATAAIGWQGDTEGKRRDPLYRKMEEIVRTLVTDFDTNVDIFSELLTDFTAFLEKEKRRIAVLERRTLDAEDGKAKAEIARTTVAIEIELRTIDQPLPEVVHKMIDGAWNNVLFVTGLKFGYSSDEWNGCLETLEELVWSVQPPKSVEDRQKLIRLVPSLLKKLRTGFDTISFNPFEMSALFKSLEEVHLACIRGKAVSVESKPQVESKETVSKKVVTEEGAAKDITAKDIVAKETATKDLEAKPVESRAVEPPKEPEQPQLKAEPQLKETQAAVEPEPLESAQMPEPIIDLDDVDEILNEAQVENGVTETAEESASASLDDIDDLPDSDPNMQQVKQFVQGAWFDFKNDDGSTSRCRLAAFIKPTGKYIFVNRNGMKVAEKSQQELAKSLKLNTLMALDNSMLFDRALETVVTSLRKN